MNFFVTWIYTDFIQWKSETAKVQRLVKFSFRLLFFGVFLFWILVLTFHWFIYYLFLLFVLLMYVCCCAIIVDRCVSAKLFKTLSVNQPEFSVDQVVSIEISLNTCLNLCSYVNKRPWLRSCTITRIITSTQISINQLVTTFFWKAQYLAITSIFCIINRQLSFLLLLFTRVMLYKRLLNLPLPVLLPVQVSFLIFVNETKSYNSIPLTNSKAQDSVKPWTRSCHAGPTFCQRRRCCWSRCIRKLSCQGRISCPCHWIGWASCQRLVLHWTC